MNDPAASRRNRLMAFQTATAAEREPVSRSPGDRGASGEAPPGGNRFDQVVEQGPRRVRVGIDEDEPVAGGVRRAGVTRA